MTGYGNPIGEASVEELLSWKDFYEKEDGADSFHCRCYKTELMRRARFNARFLTDRRPPSPVVAWAVDYLKANN